MDLLYQEDDALFGFFMKGLSALESFYYSLYALGALLYAQAVPPSDQFPLLDPAHLGGLRNINLANTYLRYTQVFPGLPITKLMGRILEDETYLAWQQIRNVLAHRVATAGRIVHYPGPSFSELPFSVTAWAGDIPLDAMMTASRYNW